MKALRENGRAASRSGLAPNINGFRYFAKGARRCAALQQNGVFSVHGGLFGVKARAGQSGFAVN